MSFKDFKLGQDPDCTIGSKLFRSWIRINLIQIRKHLKGYLIFFKLMGQSHIKGETTRVILGKIQ